ncbi:MAG: hypothetical protein JW395_1590 [Nitrospira sp.]|nr:hypothetical protein [Nitrospira sp.]
METLTAVVLLAGICFVVFRYGKQHGSRLGFGAGRRLRRRRSR